jgi:hypothetical protein
LENLSVFIWSAAEFALRDMCVFKDELDYLKEKFAKIYEDFLVKKVRSDF